MKPRNLDKWFEDNFIKGTCFNNIKELQEDKTTIAVNAPRALIACNLQGAYNGIRKLNNHIENGGN